MTIVSKAFYRGLVLAGNAMQKKFSNYTQNAFEVNKTVLFNIINDNKDTLYGLNHNFKSIKNIDNFKKEIPLNEYSDFEKYIISESKGKKIY